MTQPSGQPAIRVKICRARLSESFSSPVTATLDDGRAVTIPGIYFQRNIGLSFNDRTGILHGTPTEYGEFPVRVVWELAPKNGFPPTYTLLLIPVHTAPALLPPQPVFLRNSQLPPLPAYVRGISGSALFLS